MSEKKLSSRIQQKHDTEANWLKATNFTPRAGELIIYDVDNMHSTPRFKVGDGSTLVSNLPFEEDDKASLSGSNTFTGVNTFNGPAPVTSQIGFHLGNATKVNEIWRFDSVGIKAFGGSEGSLKDQTIKLPDLSSFTAITTHTIPLNDTDNTFTGTNTFIYKDTTSQNTIKLDPTNGNVLVGAGSPDA